MSYLKKTFQYLFVLEKGKRFFLLLLLGIPVGIFTSLVMPTNSIIIWLKDYTTGNPSFIDAWKFGNASGLFWVAIVIDFVLLIINIAIATSIISRSLRVGVFKANRLYDEFNESFFPAATSVVTFTILFLFAKVVISLILAAIQYIETLWLSKALTIASMVILIVIGCSFTSVSMLFLPIMSFNGLKPKNAMIDSFRKCSRKIWQLFTSISLPLTVVLVIGNVVGLMSKMYLPKINVSVLYSLSIIVDSILYSLSFCYIITLSMISYYEIEEIVREDYPREFFFKKDRR